MIEKKNELIWYLILLSICERLRVCTKNHGNNRIHIQRNSNILAQTLTGHYDRSVTTMSSLCARAAWDMRAIELKYRTEWSLVRPCLRLCIYLLSQCAGLLAEMLYLTPKAITIIHKTKSTDILYWIISPLVHGAYKKAAFSWIKYHLMWLIQNYYLNNFCLHNSAHIWVLCVFVVH